MVQWRVGLCGSQISKEEIQCRTELPVKSGVALPYPQPPFLGPEGGGAWGGQYTEGEGSRRVCSGSRLGEGILRAQMPSFVSVGGWG